MPIANLRNQHWKAAGFFLALSLVMFAPVLFLGKAFGDSDITQGTYPGLQFIQSVLRYHQSPFWAPGVFSGFPLFVSGAYFNPGFLLLKYFSVFAVYHWLTALGVAAAAFGMYLFLRSLRLSWAGSVTGGTTYVMGLWIWVIDGSLLVGIAILPLLLWCVYRYYQRAHWSSGLAGALTFAFGLYAANFNFMPMIAAAAAGLALGLAYYGDGNGWKQRLLRAPLGCALMIVGGILLAFPQLYATYIFSSLSGRGAGLSFDAASVGALTFLDAVKMVLPYVNLPGILTAGTYVYLGILPVVLVWFFLLNRGLPLLRGIFRRTDGEETGLQKIFLLLGAFSLLVALKYSPVFWLLHRLPLLNSLRVPGRWLLLTVMCAAALAGFGLDHLRGLGSDSIGRRFIRAWGYLLAGLWATLALSTAAAVFFRQPIIGWLQRYFAEHFYTGEKLLPMSHYYAVIQDLLNRAFDSFDLRHYSVLAPMFFFTLGYWLLQRYKEGRFSSVRFVSTVVAVSVLNLVVVLFPFHAVVSTSQFSGNQPVISYLKQHPGKYLTFLPGFTEWQLLTVPYHPTHAEALTFEEQLLPPNLGLYFGLLQADYYHNLMSRRMSRVLALVGSDRATVGEKLSDERISVAAKVKKFEERNFLLDLLGVRYVVSAYLFPGNTLTKVLESRVEPHEIPIYLYENSGVRPAVYLVDSASVIVPSEAESYRQVLKGGLGPRDAIIECEGACPTTDKAASGEVRIAGQTNGSWRIAVTTLDQRWLVVQENNLPGWEAKLDGQVQPISTANSVFLSVLIPPGSHSVELTYHFPWNK